MQVLRSCFRGAAARTGGLGEALAETPHAQRHRRAHGGAPRPAWRRHRHHRCCHPPCMWWAERPGLWHSGPMTTFTTPPLPPHTHPFSSFLFTRHLFCTRTVYKDVYLQLYRCKSLKKGKRNKKKLNERVKLLTATLLGTSRLYSGSKSQSISGIGSGATDVHGTYRL